MLVQGCRRSRWGQRRYGWPCCVLPPPSLLREGTKRDDWKSGTDSRRSRWGQRPMAGPAMCPPANYEEENDVTMGKCSGPPTIGDVDGGGERWGL